MRDIIRKCTFTKSDPAKINAWLISSSNALLFGRLRYTQINDAVDYAKFYGRSHDALICVYDEAGNVILTHEHKDDFKE